MWIKRRDKIINTILRPIIYSYLKIFYNIKIDKPRGFKNGAIIFSNHVMKIDPLIVGVMISNPIYYIANEDISDNKYSNKLINFFFRPILKARNKNIDFRTIRYATMVSKENGIVGIFPEGKMSLTGENNKISISTIKLCKRLKKPIVVINIEGGYQSNPSWSINRRKGPIKATFKNIYSYDDYKDIDNEILYNKISSDLNVDNLNNDYEYKGKNLALYLERILYVCPCCKKKNTISTNGNYISCTSCGLRVEYKPNLKLIGNRDSFKLNSINSWYKYDIEEISNKIYKDNDIIYRDDCKVYILKTHKKDVLLGMGTIYLYNDKFLFKLDSQTIILEFNIINNVELYGDLYMDIFIKNDIYRVKGNIRTNLVKYIDIYNLIKENR